MGSHRGHDSTTRPTSILPNAVGTFLVDTNVILVANRQHEGVGEADIQRCIQWLNAIMQCGRVALDSGHEILHEYMHKTRAVQGQGIGSTFLDWLLHHQNDPTRVDLVEIETDPVLGYRNFPRDNRLVEFDPADRKFVAVALAHPAHPVILQATDSKWLDWSGPLNEHGVRVQFLCEGVLRTFHQHKFGV